MKQRFVQIQDETFPASVFGGDRRQQRGGESVLNRASRSGISPRNFTRSTRNIRQTYRSDWNADAALSDQSVLVWLFVVHDDVLFLLRHTARLGHLALTICRTVRLFGLGHGICRDRVIAYAMTARGGWHIRMLITRQRRRSVLMCRVGQAQMGARPGRLNGS